MNNLLDALVLELEARILAHPDTHVDSHVETLLDDAWAKLVATGRAARLEKFRKDALAERRWAV